MFKKYQTTNNINHCFFYGRLLGILLACSLFFSAPALHARKNGATIIPVPAKSGGFPDTAEAMEALLHHENGITEPLLFRKEALKETWPAIILIPEWFKGVYGNKPVNISNILHNEKDIVLIPDEKTTLSTVIEMIESGKYHRMAIDAIVDKESETTVRNAVKQAMQLEMKGDLKDSEAGDEAPATALLFHDHDQLEGYFTFPKRTEKQEKTIKMPPQTWQHFLKLRKGKGLSQKQLSHEYHKIVHGIKKSSLMLPPQFMTLYIAGEHYIFGPYQPLNNTSSVIIQTYGEQKFILVAPDQAPASSALFDTKGESNYIWPDLSASEDTLRNEKRLANKKLYSVVLCAGDVLMIPANWFIYQQSLSTSIWATFTYFPDDIFPLTPRVKLTRERLPPVRKTLLQWAEKEIKEDPGNRRNVSLAVNTINTCIHNATYRKPDLGLVLANLRLTSLPAEVAQIKHIKRLDLRGNRLTRFSMSNMENMESLNLSDNLLTTFSVSNMKELKSLYLGNNELTAFNCCSSDLPNIQFIDLRRNQLKNLEEGCILSINRDKSLVLYLSGNPLTEEAVYQIQLDLLSRNGDNQTHYPEGASLLPPAELLMRNIRRKAISCESFIELLKSNDVSRLPELQCPITKTVPEQVIFLKQNDVYQIFDAEALLQWYDRLLSKGVVDPLANPITSKQLKPQDIFSASECPRLKEMYK